MVETTAVPRSYYLWTIGCQMNLADSQRLESALLQLGIEAVERPQDADVLVFNSCVVRQQAEDKVVGNLTATAPIKKRRPGQVVALMGCMVGPNSQDLRPPLSPTSTSSCDPRSLPLCWTCWGSV